MNGAAHPTSAWRRPARCAWALACGVIVLAAVYAASVPPASAATAVEDYRDRVATARAAVEAYIETGAIEGGGDVAIAVFTALPSIERVRMGETEVMVDNSVLRTLVARIDVSRDPERRLEIATDMAHHLASIERSLPGGSDRPPASDPDALARLLEDSRAQVRSPVAEMLGDLIDRLGEAFERWQASLAESDSASRTWSFAVGAIVVGLVLVLLWVAYRVVRGVLGAAARRGPALAGAADGAYPVVAHEAEIPADVVAFAASLAAAGRFAEAVRALFGGAARLLAEHGHVTRTRTRTNGELLAEVRVALPQVAGTLGGLAGSFERAFYGHVDPGEDGYRDALAAYATLRAQMDAATENDGS